MAALLAVARRALVVAVAALMLAGCAATGDAPAASRPAAGGPPRPMTLHVVQLAAPAGHLDEDAEPGADIRLSDRARTTDYLLGPALLTLDRLDRVDIQVDGAAWTVRLDLPPDVATRFTQLTTENVHKQIAMVVGDEVVSAPYISDPIVGGNVQLAGSFTQAEAQELADDLRSR